MGLTASIGSFLKGLSSTILRGNILHGMVSAAIATGIDEGVKRTMPKLVRFTIWSVLFFMGIFLHGWGIASWADAFFASPGMGFIIIGMASLVAGSLYGSVRA